MSISKVSRPKPVCTQRTKQSLSAAAVLMTKWKGFECPSVMSCYMNNYQILGRPAGLSEDLNKHWRTFHFTRPWLSQMVQRTPIKCWYRGSVIHYTLCTTTLKNRNIFPTPALIFRGVKKYDLWPHRLTTLTFKPPLFRNKVRNLNYFQTWCVCVDDRTMFLSYFVQIGSRPF